MSRTGSLEYPLRYYYRPVAGEGVDAYVLGGIAIIVFSSLL